MQHTLDRAFDVLGYERVLAGARALDDPTSNKSWDRCFLARVFGEVGELDSFCNQYYPNMFFEHSVAEVLNVPHWVVRQIVHHFDHEPTLFRVRVSKWLLANDPVNQNRVPKSGLSTDTSLETSTLPCQTETRDGTTIQAAPSLSWKDVRAQGWIIEKDAGLRLQVTRLGTPPSTSPLNALFTLA